MSKQLTPFPTCAAALALLLCGVAHAAMPPSYYRKLKAEAPEHFVLKVIEATATPTRRGVEFGVMEVRAVAEVLEVRRSDSGLGPSQRIEIEYTTPTKYPPGWAGPSLVRVVSQGQEVEAWLRKGDDGEYRPAAAGMSFLLIADVEKTDADAAPQTPMPDGETGPVAPAASVAPAFTGPDGQSVYLAEGKKLYVVFWCSWCPSALAHTLRIAEALREDLAEGDTVLGISLDSDDESYREALAVHALKLSGWRHVRVADEEAMEWFTATGIEALPTVAVFDDAGERIAFYRGLLQFQEARQ